MTELLEHEWRRRMFLWKKCSTTSFEVVHNPFSGVHNKTSATFVFFGTNMVIQTLDLRHCA